MSDSWSDPLSTFIHNVCEQRRLWRDCAHAKAQATYHIDAGRLCDKYYNRMSWLIFSSPVRSPRPRLRPRSCHTATKFYFQVFQKFISRQPLIRKHSYLDHRYPGGLAFIPWFLAPGLMPLGGARGQNLGHLWKVFFYFSVMKTT